MTHSAASLDHEFKSTLSDTAKDVLSVAEEIVESTPELLGTGLSDLATTGFAFYASFVNTIVNEILQITVPGLNMLSNPNLSIPDAFAAMFQGGRQLTDQATHRPVATTIKGIGNVSRGIGLSAITGVCSTLGTAAAVALASQGMAAALGMAFLLSCDDVIVAARRLQNPKYWLSDSVAKWETLSLKTIPQLQAEIDHLEKSSWIAGKNSMAVWALKNKTQRLAKLIKEKDEIKEDIRARVEENQECKLALKELYSGSDETSIRVNTLIATTDPKMHDTKQREAQAIINCKIELKKAIELSLYAGVTFSGMLLLCIPGAQLAGGILIAISVAMLVKKYGAALMEHAPKTKLTHFVSQKINQSKPGSSTDSDSDSPSLLHPK